MGTEWNVRLAMALQLGKSWQSDSSSSLLVLGSWFSHSPSGSLRVAA